MTADLQAANYIKETLPDCGTVIVSSTTHVSEDGSATVQYTAGIFRKGVHGTITAHAKADRADKVALSAIAKYIEATK